MDGRFWTIAWILIIDLQRDSGLGGGPESTAVLSRNGLRQPTLRAASSDGCAICRHEAVASSSVQLRLFLPLTRLLLPALPALLFSASPNHVQYHAVRPTPVRPVYEAVGRREPGGPFAERLRPN